MSTEGVVRTTGRIKKPKHFFDPSDYDVPRPVRSSNNNTHITAQSSNSSERYSNGSNNSSLNSDQKKNSRSPSATPAAVEIVDVCSVCSKRDAKRGIHAKNKLVQCQHCDKKIHKLCLPIDFEDIDVLMKNYKCTKCRKCAACNNTSANGHEVSKDLITCAKCVKSYHMQCHVPPVLKYQQFIRNWRCAQCIGPKIDEIHTIIGTENKTTQAHTLHKNNNSLAEKTISAGNESTTTKTTLKENNKRSASESGLQPIQAVARDKQYNPTQQQVVMQKSYIGTQHISTIVQHQPFAESDIKQVKNTNSSANVMPYAITNGKSGENRVALVVNVDGVASKKPKFSDDASVNIVTDETSNGTATLPLYSSTDAIEIPKDVKYWTVDKVFEYFSKYFPVEAHVFKEQEIDGMSLLLLKRSDVVKKLPIKLGPSLRLYNLILKIQAQVNDPTLGWNVGQ